MGPSWAKRSRSEVIDEAEEVEVAAAAWCWRRVRWVMVARMVWSWRRRWSGTPSAEEEAGEEDGIEDGVRERMEERW